MAGRFAKFVRILRAPFFTAVIVPSILGGILAWGDGSFSLWLLILAVIGAVAVNAGLNLSNDYFDHLSGTDALNQNLTPFSGGSRSIQDGVATPRQVLALSALFYALAIGIGLYLSATRGWLLLAIGAAGLFLAVFHNAPPFRLYHVAPGVGEVASGVGCGPLVLLGSYYVQTRTLSWEALWVSVPLGLLIIAILYINEFPDCESDQAVGKKTVPVVLGRERAVWGYVALLIAAYLVILAGTIFGVFPYAALLSLVTVPLAWRGIQGAIRFHSDLPALVATQATTVQLHVAAGLLLCVGYVVSIVLA